MACAKKNIINHIHLRLIGYFYKKKRMRSVLVIDNHDSFVHNIIHLFKEGGADRVVRIYEEQYCFEFATAFDCIVLSPGPGLPHHSKGMMQCLEDCAQSHKILGICLGHQAIVAHFGGQLIQVPHIKHGHKATVYVKDNKDPNYKYLGSVFNAALYNSWTTCPKQIPDDLALSAVDESGGVMSVYHRTLPVFGMQFHPESVVSDCGKAIIRAFLEI